MLFVSGGIYITNEERDDIIIIISPRVEDEDEGAKTTKTLKKKKEKRTVKQRHFPQSARVHLRAHADEGADEGCRRREEHSSWRSFVRPATHDDE